MGSLLRRLIDRCETHDRSSRPRIRQLEQDLGYEPSGEPENIIEAYRNPALIDCDNSWCRRRR